MRKTIWAGIFVGLSALAIACSSSSSNAGDTACSGSTCSCTGNCPEEGDDEYHQPDSGGDATTFDGCAVQSLPVNAAACPATYSISYAGELCSPAGLQCWYPGEGDIGANGCSSPATLRCEFPDSGLGDVPDAAIFDDAGDASVGYWEFAQ